MRAIQLRAHPTSLENAPEQLIYDEDVPDPKPQPGDAIIRVYACAISPGELRWSASYEARGGGRRLPSIPGHEVAGIVDRVPEVPEALRALEGLEEGARTLQPGDEVYALGDVWRDGGAAEFMAIRASDLAPKPKLLSWAEAASVPLSALTAWQGLRDRAHLSKGQRVLVLDADASPGLYAVQLAHYVGAYVIAVAAAPTGGVKAGDSQYLLTSLGADEVLAATEFGRRLEQKLDKVDVVFDASSSHEEGGEALEHSWKLLCEGGVLLTTEGSVPPEKADEYGVTAFQYVAEPSRDALVEIGRLIEEGRLRPVIEAVMPLKEAKQAFQLGLAQHHKGKIVLEVVPQRLSVSATGE